MREPLTPQRSLSPCSPARWLRAVTMGSVIAVGGLTMAPAAMAEAPLQKVQAPGWYRLMLGQFEVTALNDGTVELPVDRLLQGPAPVIAKGLAHHHLSSPLETSVNAFLINTGSKLVLVDAGAGTLFGPTLGKLAAQIASAGYRTDQVDHVLITHMHPDHVGGLSAEGKIVFPRATVHLDQADRDFWMSKANMDAAPADRKGLFQGAQVSLAAYEAAGKLKTFNQDGEVVPGISAKATHGHTAGHTVYVVESQGKRMTLIGDLIHVAAVQLASPHITIGFDSDAKQARAQRLQTFQQLAKEGSLVGASHLPFPGVGRLQAAGKGYTWLPLNYSSQVK